VVTVTADTHALVWHLTDPRRLGRGARQAFDQIDAGRWLCYVPAMALVEIALLYERGRLRVSVGKVVEILADHRSYSVLAVDLEQVLEFASRPGLRDPMDRLILAAARATGSRLLSSDGAFDGFGVERVWD
jgi:PIN domain nuclease of toxin-antitoxin system